MKVAQAIFSPFSSFFGLFTNIIALAIVYLVQADVLGLNH
jgi:hypothetical protein